MTEHRNGFIYVCFFPSRCIVLHCFHWKRRQLNSILGRLRVHGGRLRYEGICQIQNRYDFLKGENLSYNVDISLSASFKHLKLMPEPRNGFIYVSFFPFTLYSGVSWPSGLAYRTQVLVLEAECGFESRPWHQCSWARHLIIIASLHPGVKLVPVRAELVD